MKNTALTILAGLGLATMAQAGSDYSPQPIPVAPAPSCLWTWFAGGSYGQIDGDDWDEDIYTLHIGIERKCADNPCGSHAFFLEVGYTEKDETFDIVFVPDPPVAVFVNEHDFEARIVPITLNYKYECSLAGNLNWYVGAGVGVALVDLDISGQNVDGSWDDTVFYGHIFAGLTYNVSESFEIYGGARYIFMDDPDVAGYDEALSLDEDVHYELGARFNF
ncbi:hypothetical protein NT6N_29030 [Oceaniferula spumae]|uniref:Outer membrane protein beta-barrel domain-containing protein n=1 Tax=Oceaniferula spumae TaxID=2979115 RepID=A0AAT9FPH4_9BACT